MAIVSILLFGFVLGCFAKHEQLWAAPAKITAGLIFSGLICFPSLYIFATLAGARVSISQLAACLAGALALAGLLLLGFAPGGVDLRGVHRFVRLHGLAGRSAHGSSRWSSRCGF